MAAANAPITMKETLTLQSIGVNPQFITFTNVTMESDKYICVRETSPQNSVVIIDMNMPMQPLRRPITADSALMNPNSRILALKAQVPGTSQDHLQIFNIEAKQKIKSYQMPEQVVFWKWITPKMLGLVTQTSVYHWPIEGDSEPVKMFDRTANLANNQIINYRCDPSEKWLVLIGIAPGSPEGQMKLFGTIVYPKNGYLTMQFSRGGKNVVCEDYLDNMIVFSDAWWIGRKDENPEEARLEFPKELNVQQEKSECDFKGGAGATGVQKRSTSECGVKHVEQQSPEHEQEELLSESQNDSKEFIELTPSRRSARAAGKKINFAEVSSGDELVDNEVESSEEEEKTGSDILCDETVVQSQVTGKITALAETASKSKKSPRTKQSSLVQATISTMFKKVDKLVTPDRVSQRKTRKSTNKGESNTESGSTMPDHVGTSQSEDDIEELSSSSKDTEASDEDWAA